MAEDAPIDNFDRAAVRRDMKARRGALPATERLAAGAALADTLLASSIRADAGRLAGYWSIGGEIPLHALLTRLPSGITYHLPRLADDGRLRFAAWRPGEPLTCNRHGIPEPDPEHAESLMPNALDIVLVPLLAFDRRGHRLGMGAGWYDRSFAERRHAAPPPLLIGVAYAFQEIDHVPDREHDVPLDLIATERELIPCQRGTPSP